MMMRLNKVISFLFFVVFSNSVASQNNHESYIEPDSLKGMGSQELTDLFYANSSMPEKAMIYVDAYKYRAKRDNDTIKIANGFYFMYWLNDNNEFGLSYLDSITNLTERVKDKFYPTAGYHLKGDYFFNKGDFDQSLQNYLKAYNSISEYTNIRLKYNVKRSIALLQSRIGNYEEALMAFKECFDFYVEKNYKEEASEIFLGVLFSLAETYVRNNKLDSASYYNAMGYRESVLAKNNLMRDYFVLGEGVNQFHKQNYRAAIDSINVALNNSKNEIDISNLAFAHFYLGKAYDKLRDKRKSIDYFLHVDSIYTKIPDLEPEFREVYVKLIGYYKSIKNTEKQLEFVNKLILKDSILNHNFKYLSKNIYKEYDTPELIADKEKLIWNLEKKNEKNIYKNLILSFFLVVLTGMSVYLFIRQRKFRKRFEKLMNSNSQLSFKGDAQVIDKKKKQEPLSTKIGVSDTVVAAILEGLNDFVEKEKYLDNTITLNKLSKNLKTNSNYLSKVINYYEQKNFSNYINDLRIDYTVEQLKTNKQFRLYSVKGIAEEVGFNSTESFSKAFFKRTGIYPSYFIKQLEKQ
ncbi:helix-turn-helix domain-containing protein [Leptobacterium flavescens]|uniref:Helix-turn-helix domain-containing protein n=1 Tax=Leptobacterium flavescens TaxID=472055 RepID=A0A6P0ULG1_9FLAO|nr:helix-turn-helix domain-containing protein [Leptobacterium flavescens]NER12729.1 helix-turn-helix domain-containing protein [Leptobacterium flavescens]